jgi:hypothetical protein
MAFGPIPPGHHVHHINHDQRDNSIENLQLLDAGFHRWVHGRVREDHRMLGSVEHRSCQRCHVYKPLAMFSRRSAGTYHGYCNVCVRESVRAWKRQEGGAWRKLYYQTVEKPARLAARAARLGK